MYAEHRETYYTQERSRGLIKKYKIDSIYLLVFQYQNKQDGLQGTKGAQEEV